MSKIKWDGAEYHKCAYNRSQRRGGYVVTPNPSVDMIYFAINYWPVACCQSDIIALSFNFKECFRDNDMEFVNL